MRGLRLGNAEPGDIRVRLFLPDRRLRPRLETIALERVVRLQDNKLVPGAESDREVMRHGDAAAARRHATQVDAEEWAVETDTEQAQQGRRHIEAGAQGRVASRLDMLGRSDGRRGGKGRDSRCRAGGEPYD